MGGLCFGYMSSRCPQPVVQVWKRGGESRLLSVWPATDFERRLHGLRDVHREAMTAEGSSRWAMRLSSEEWWGGDAAANIEKEQQNASRPASDTEEAADASAAPSAHETA